MARQPTQQFGAAEEQYGGQVGQQGTGQFGQQPGQSGQGSQQFGQPGGQQQGMSQQGGGMDIKLEEGLTDEMRVVLHDLVQSATACEWCAERCIDEGPGMAECIRLCRDVADLATLNVQLMARDSVFGPEAIQVFADAAEACAQECARHGHRHCQECAEVLSRAVQSTRKMLASFGQSGGQIQGGQMETGGMGGGMRGGGMSPQGGQTQAPGGSFQGQEFQGGSFGQSQAPGQQTQLPIEGGSGIQGGQGQEIQPQGQGFQQPQGESFGQPRGQQFGQGQQPGPHYSEGQPSQGQSGPQGPPPGQQF